MRYNRGSLSDTMRVALKVGGYVFATAYGYVIDRNKPPATQSYYDVRDGKATLYEHNHLTGRYEVVIQEV